MSENILRVSLILTEMFQHASATLPVIAILTLIAGRRGNSQLCLTGGRLLLKSGFFLGVIGICSFPLAYLGEMLSFGGEDNIWQPFFALPGLPWSGSMTSQICGALLLGAACATMPAQAAGQYNFKVFKTPVILSLLAAFAFAATFFLISWPFAGYPQGLSGERVFQAVFRNALNHYFMAFCPAGALSLLLVFPKSALGGRELTASEKTLACRWLAVWAFIGYVPYLLQSWAILIGVSVRGNIGAAGPNYLGFHLLTLALLSLAVCLWLYQMLSKKVCAWAGIAAFALFLGYCWIT